MPEPTPSPVPSSEPSKDPSAAAARRRRSSWPRRLLKCLGVALAIAAVAYFVVTQTAVTRWIVLSRVGSILNAKVTADALKIDPDGVVSAENVEVRAPGVPGEGAVVFRVHRLEAIIGLRRLMMGEIHLRSLTLEEPLARLSQSVDDGRLNIADLRVPEMGGGELKSPPRVVVRRGKLELGEHAKGSFVSLYRVDIEGDVEKKEESGESTIRFRQVEGGLVPDAPLVEGHFGAAGLSLTLNGLTLSKFPPEAVPTPLREAYRALALDGRIKGITFDYKADGQVEAEMALDGVALNLPVEAKPSEDREGKIVPLPPEQVGRQMRLQRTNGTISLRTEGGKAHIEAALRGYVEELPYDVRLVTRGASTDSAFVLDLSCRAFDMTSNPQILRFATATAQRRMEQFSHPTGIVDADVRIERAEPTTKSDGTTEPGALRVSGVLKMRDGTAAFERFPYRFEKMTGEWRFDENRIDIVGIEGIAPGGAKVKANGWIAPLTEDAGAEINVSVRDLPIDEALEEGMGKRRRILDALFNRERYQQLLAAGRVVPPAAHDEARRELATLEARGSASGAEAERWRKILATPAFEPGGRAQVEVRVWRIQGVMGDEAWNDTVTIDLAHASLVPEKFPYPLLGEGVTIQKKNDDATIQGGTYRGLRGGVAIITSQADLSRVDDPSVPFVPAIQVQAKGVPVDDLFIHAIPENPSTFSGDSPVKMLNDLRISGVTDCDVDLKPTPTGDVNYTVRVTTAGASASPFAPGGGPPRVVASDIAGTVVVTQDGLQVDLNGKAGAAGSTPESRSPIAVRSGVRFGEDGGSMWAEVGAKGIDVSTAGEDLVGIVSPAGREKIEDIRREYDPSGRTDLDVEVRRQRRDETAVVVDLANLDMGFTYQGARTRLSDTEGRVKFTAGLGGALGRYDFDRFKAGLQADQTAPGRVEAHGPILIDASPAAAGDRFELALAGGCFESPLVRHTVGKVMGPASGAKYAKADPSGAFDLQLAMLGVGDADENKSAPKWQVTGTLTPKSLTMTSNAVRVAFPRVEGEVHLTKSGGAFKELVLHAPTWTARADGGWHTLGEGTFVVDTALALTCPGFPEDLRAVLPDTLMGVLRDIKFDAKGPIELKDSTLAAEFRRADDDPTGDHASKLIRAQGQLIVRDASADVGAQITNCDATVDFGLGRAGAEKSGELDLWISAPTFKAAGVSMTNGRARLQKRDDGGLVLPLISADVHGGRLGATASVLPLPEGKPEGTPRDYECQIRLSGVGFTPFVDDLKASGTPPTDAPSPADASPSAPSPPAPPAGATRGRLDAEVSIGGKLGDVNSRRGRGSIKIGGGERVVNVPLVVPLVRLTNFQLPIDEAIDYARADFFLTGRRASFEEIVISSSSVGLFGYGTGDIDGHNLDLRFRSKAYLRIPIISPAIESIRNELVTAQVRGSLQKPEIGISTLSGTGRLLDRVVGKTPTDQDVRLDQIQERAERGRSILTPRPEDPGRIAPK